MGPAGRKDEMSLALQMEFTLSQDPMGRMAKDMLMDQLVWLAGGLHA